MAQNSKIEWTDTTWNPLAGCTRVSPGCDNCYAAKMSLRLEAMALADIEAGRNPGGKAKYIGIASKNGKGVAAFNGTVNLDYNELQRPYSWKKPRRVFVNSMSDLFHKDVPDRFIFDSFIVMSDNPQHTFQVLTKRPDRAADFTGKLSYVPRNILFGTSVENQEQANKRIPDLLKINASMRFLSMEPLLGPVDLDFITEPTGKTWRPLFGHEGHWATYYSCNPARKIDWVIVGGESGVNARPMHPGWVRSIRDQCVGAGVPFFFKQWGEYSARGVRVGKRAAGRLLDGRSWDEFPKMEAA